VRRLLTRRRFLQALGASAIGGLALGGYAFAVEPLHRLRIRTYRLTPPRWTDGLKLRVAVVADLHACEPWMGLARIRDIVNRVNALEPDLILLLGDYSRGAGSRWVSGEVHSRDWASALARLAAPLGVFAVMGNHDWWDDRTAQRNGHGPIYGRMALEANGVQVLENDAVRLTKLGAPFWVAGLGDQLAFTPWSRYKAWKGVDDLPATLAKVGDDAPVLLMAHEPDIFPQVPDQVSLTLSGHTHGGQVRLLGYSPVVPSRFGNRYAYGHVVEDGRHLIVSGGLGISILPVRFGCPPEIVLLELGG
jgi:predicted MPP superfamily phosphohydrolase